MIEQAYADGTTESAEAVRQTEMLQALGLQRLITNLGEGLGGKESCALVQAFVDAIHVESTAMIQEGATAAAATEQA